MLLAELCLAWRRLWGFGARLRYRDSVGLLVAIGGMPPDSRWIGLDIEPGPTVHCVYDCRRSLPFADESVRSLHCSNFFEKIDYTEEVPFFLAECQRVLEPGGIFRLVVFDAEACVREYVRRVSDCALETAVTADARTPMDTVNAALRGAGRKQAYDYETLKFLLERYGFEYVRRGIAENRVVGSGPESSASENHRLCIEGVKSKVGGGQ